MISPSHDSGNYVVGLLEAGDRADEVSVQGVSTWTMPQEVSEILGQRLGKNVVFNAFEPQTYEQYLPENVRDELSEMMQWIGEASYCGKGSESKQAESGQWLLAKG